ncbi:TetR/AcrR family transcriptional regulator [Mycobacterium sp. MYCO198283]|uniref:TetR/AcrR family transcriptional regulator n=1 Tax=Mycobacterium sp. MYCO198283 TaxID=2883505 RepID=UPI001E58BA6E|nr:TetR/AcrR family transcriptional regulator; helix-turn-helix transcriptional regulator [Mycobacterium sp. MYCO198283]MCG5432014.1 TetR/AcrR family transcriptional regulator [Mycobacterium sp. MYCO198283]
MAAAVRSGLAEGRFVPLEQIAADAGVGIGTLYRRYPSREALLEALAVRAYRLILAEAHDAMAHGETGLDAIGRFLRQTFDHRDELVLPLHGAPMTADTESAELRSQMHQIMEAIVARGHRDGSVRPDVTAGAVVRFGAMLARPMSNVPDWPDAAAEQRAIFLRGIAAHDG